LRRRGDGTGRSALERPSGPQRAERGRAESSGQGATGMCTDEAMWECQIQFPKLSPRCEVSSSNNSCGIERAFQRPRGATVHFRSVANALGLIIKIILRSYIYIFEPWLSSCRAVEAPSSRCRGRCRGLACRALSSLSSSCRAPSSPVEADSMCRPVEVCRAVESLSSFSVEHRRLSSL
jgi:hypothetical protein